MIPGIVASAFPDIYFMKLKMDFMAAVTIWFSVDHIRLHGQNNTGKYVQRELRLPDRAGRGRSRSLAGDDPGHGQILTHYIDMGYSFCQDQEIPVGRLEQPEKHAGYRQVSNGGYLNG